MWMKGGTAYEHSKLSRSIAQQVLFNLSSDRVEQYPAVCEHLEQLVPAHLPPGLNPLGQWHHLALVLQYTKQCIIKV